MAVSESAGYPGAGRDRCAGQSPAPGGMPRMRQTLFSLYRVRALGPASATSVALCTAYDSELRPLLEAHVAVS